MTSKEVEVRVTKEQRPLRCLICAHDRFLHHRMSLTGPVGQVLDWPGLPADGYSCLKCGFVHWFVAVG